MNTLDDTNERAAQQLAAEAEMEDYRESEDGKFHLDNGTAIFFDMKDIVYDKKRDAMGKGTFSEMVYRGKFKPFDMPIAIKSMNILDRQSGDNERKGRDDRANEAQMLRRGDAILVHPNVVKLYGFVTEEMTFYMCMELMDASLSEVKLVVYNSPDKLLEKPQIEFFLGCVVVSVVDALAFFRNDARVLHRDLKPANIMLNAQGEIKICDFGVSKKLQNATSKTRATTGGIGTHIYMAPERFNGDLGVGRGYGSKSEVWSLGITLVELATGVHPYGALSSFSTPEVIGSEKEPSPSIADKEYSSKLRNFTNACLFKSEAQRASVLPLDASSADGKKDTNNLQSKQFYTANAARSDRNACVKAMLDHIADGLPAIRAKLTD